jgi:serpin B
MAGFEVGSREFRGKEERIADPLPSHRLNQPGGTQTFAQDNNDFALAMYGKLRQKPGNLFFSPFSIRAGLAMAQAGARDETAVEMREALSSSSSDEAMHVGFAETVQRLNAAGRGEYEMAVANSLWGQDGAPLQPEFSNLIARHYSGDMNLVDFRRGAEAARATMNRWVADKTRQKIRELIPSGGLDVDTYLVLVNAVYFKGRWVLPFRKADSLDKPFHLEGGGKVQTPMMHQQKYMRYMQGGGYQAVDLDYSGGDLSMLVFLPDRTDGLLDLEKTLSARMLHDCVEQMSTREVKLFLPRFKITWGTVNLSDQLRVLGMPLAFSRFQANFSGINGHAPPDEDSLFLSSVFHKAFIETNEEGTEAAAATAVQGGYGYGCGSEFPKPVIPTFRAHHPFLFAIRDRNSGTILFLGRMADPTRES